MSIEQTVQAGFPAITLVSAASRLRATFVPALNMLCSSLLHDGQELLHLRAGIAAYAERGKTCGIPFLHPWANRLSGDSYEVDGRRVTLTEAARPITRDANGLPNHGLLGGRTAWDVIEQTSASAETVVVARLNFTGDALLSNFPFPHELRIRAALDESSLAISTTLTPSSALRVPVSFGYHPYFALPGVAREAWRVCLPVRTRLVLDERQLPTGRTEPVEIETAPLGERTFDDAFTDLVPPGAFSLEGGGRRLDVVFEDGYPFAQLYAPERSDFFCIEPMTAPANALVRGGPALRFAKSGSSFQATFRIRVSRS